MSLGLWQNFGSDDSFERSRAIVRRAFDLGITHFDLADNYGPTVRLRRGDELGHHHDLMTTSSQWRARGEAFAGQFALELADEMWDDFLRVFPL